MAKNMRFKSKQIINNNMLTTVLTNEIKHLQLTDKLELVQMIWNDIDNELSKTEIPESHKKMLDQRIKEIESGNAKFYNWNDIKQNYGL